MAEAEPGFPGEYNVLAYDLEVMNNLVDPKKKKPGEITFDDYDKMGISVLTIWDFRMKRLIFLDRFDIKEGRAHELLNGCDLRIGFNNQHFDDNVITGFTGTALRQENCYDIKAEIVKVTKDKWTKGKFSEICWETIGQKKEFGEGEMAPDLFQKGHFGKLFTYNADELMLFSVLVPHIAEYGWIKLPARAGKKWGQKEMKIADFWVSPPKVSTQEETS